MSWLVYTTVIRNTVLTDRFLGGDLGISLLVNGCKIYFGACTDYPFQVSWENMFYGRDLSRFTLFPELEIRKSVSERWLFNILSLTAVRFHRQPMHIWERHVSLKEFQVGGFSRELWLLPILTHASRTFMPLVADTEQTKRHLMYWYVSFSWFAMPKSSHN